LTVLIVHLLKWQFQADRRKAGWRATMREQRGRIGAILANNPNLAPQVPRLMDAAYKRAREKAAAETRLPLTTFPAACPFSIDDIVDAP
jgi:Domain of unknown function DUF29